MAWRVPHSAAKAKVKAKALEVHSLKVQVVAVGAGAAEDPTDRVNVHVGLEDSSGQALASRRALAKVVARAKATARMVGAQVLRTPVLAMARLRDEVKRLETVDLVISDDPLARQYAVEKAVEESAKASGRSTGGRGGMRGGVKRRGR